MGKRNRAGRLAVRQVPLAEGMAAGLARVVIEQGVIDMLADGRASSAARGTADQRAHECTGLAAEERTDRPSHHAERRAGLRAAQGRGCAGGSAHERAGFAAVVEDCDLLRVAAGAGKGAYRPHE